MQSLRFDSYYPKSAQLARKAAMVQGAFPAMEVISLLVTHFAAKQLLGQAKEKGIIVIQGFEWQ